MDQQKRTYTVKDEQSGRTVTFDWHEASDPTDADMEQVFAAAGDFKPGKSVGGFLSNVVSSGKKFVGDTVAGLPALGRFGLRTLRYAVDPIGASTDTSTIQAVPQVAKGLKDHAVERYGSVDKALNTLYTDPVGVLSDVSTVAGGGASLPGKAGRVAKTVERATNPARMIAKPAATATEVSAAAVLRPSLNPSKRLRAQQRSPLEIERTAIRGGILTSKGAGKKAGAAAAETTRKAQAVTDRGVTIPRAEVSQFPETLAEVERKTPNVKPLDDLANLESEVNATLPERITPTELLDRRRSLDSDLNKVFRAAEQPGGPIPGVRESGQQELVGRMRESLRNVAPEVRESDDAARRFGMTADALEDAANRPSRLTTMIAGGGAGSALMMGSGAGALGAGAIGAALQFPQIALALGIPPAALTRLMATDPAVRAAVLARLAGQEQ
jgi:hypothetical protein